MMNTTQEGVEVEQETPVTNARNDVIADIARRAREERDREIVESGGEVIDTLNVGDETPSAEEPATEELEVKEEPEVQEEPPVDVEPPQEKLLTVKVDGKFMQVPESVVMDAGIRAVQKESAADMRLAEATRILKEVQQQSAPQKPLPNMDEAELAFRIRSGSEEEAQEAIRILMGRQTTPEAITDMVEARVLQKIEFKDAGEWFLSEYKEIAADPYLTSLAIAAEQSMRASGDQRPYADVYRDIGNNIRAKLVEWKGGKPTVSTSAEKQEKKATVTNIQAASARSAAPQQQKPVTQAEIIENMRKARGQR